MAATASSPSRACSCSCRVTRHDEPEPVIGTIALPVMSPPMIRTSALWNAPAFRNFRQHTSEPWMSVAKKILTRRPPPDRSLVVADFLRFLVPLLPLADGRPQLPARRLRRVVDGLPQALDLGARVEQHRP